MRKFALIYFIIFDYDLKNVQEPNPADPLNQEAAEVFRNNINVFKQNVNKSLAGGYVGGTHFPKMNLKKYGY